MRFSCLSRFKDDLAHIPAKIQISCAKPLLLLAVATLMTGCHSFGPDELRGTYPLYNAAIVDSQNEQFIQNIVRLHYRDPVFFLDVVSVTASLKMDLSAGLDQSAFDLSSGGAISCNLVGVGLIRLHRLLPMRRFRARALSRAYSDLSLLRMCLH